MELTDSLKALFIDTAKGLKGSARRRFMARTVQELGPGGQRRAERELGWGRPTIRKGLRELTSGFTCVDAFSARGRKRAEAHLPTLLTDIQAIVDSQSQADPQFRSTRLYTRLSAAEVRRQLILQKGYTDAQLPTVETIGAKLNALNYHPTQVAKTQPQKVPETDAIFDEVARVNAATDADEAALRLSMDAKATVKVGPFSRRGTSRVAVKAADHDFEAAATVTPVGLFLPQYDEVTVYEVTSKVTSDCLVDCLERWWLAVRHRFSSIRTLVLNLDNGPENHSRRTQFMARRLAFAQRFGLTVRLAYYPPYHSKYNPVERCWGILEQHGNGALLDSVEAVTRFTESMTWKGQHPVVELVTTTYHKGVRLTEEAMAEVETHLQRLPGLEQWFVDIVPARIPSRES